MEGAGPGLLPGRLGICNGRGVPAEGLPWLAVVCVAAGACRCGAMRCCASRSSCLPSCWLLCFLAVAVALGGPSGRMAYAGCAAARHRAISGNDRR